MRTLEEGRCVSTEEHWAERRIGQGGGGMSLRWSGVEAPLAGTARGRSYEVSRA